MDSRTIYREWLALESRAYAAAEAVIAAERVGPPELLTLAEAELWQAVAANHREAMISNMQPPPALPGQ